jgi:threonine dehydratase
MTELTLDLINEADEILHGQIRETPVEFSPHLSEMLGQPTWLKLASPPVPRGTTAKP